MSRELLTWIPFEGWLGLGGALVFALVSEINTRRRALELIRRWTAQHGLTILSLKRRTFVPFVGPAKGQFFRMKIAEANGGIREGWLRYHHHMTQPDDLRVDWDPEG